MPFPVQPIHQRAGLYTKDPNGDYYTVNYSANRNPRFYWTQAPAGWGPGNGNTEVVFAQANPASVGGGPVNLGTINPVARPTAGTQTLRYPMAGKGQGGINAGADYVLFKFFDYIPPFGPDRVGNNTGALDYNMAAEYNRADPADGYKPTLLYMPEDISTGFRANWDGKSMSNFTVGAMRSFGTTGLGNKVAAGATAINQLMQRGGALAGAASIKAATTKLGGDALSYDDIFGSISGAIMNPNTELLFGGVQMRNFQLNFKLVPRHADESIEINNIIKQFKKAMLPTSAPGSVFGFNKKNDNLGINLGFIGVPKIIQVSFMKGAGENENLPKYKMCALTNVDVNYTPDGSYATYMDGQPVAIGLSLSFQETKICYSEDVGVSIR